MVRGPHSGLQTVLFLWETTKKQAKENGAEKLEVFD